MTAAPTPTPPYALAVRSRIETQLAEFAATMRDVLANDADCLMRSERGSLTLTLADLDLLREHIINHSARLG